MSTPISLLELLQQQLKQLVQMNELLVCEREAITSRSPEKVVLVNEQKTAQLQQLQDTDNQISSSYSKDDFNTDEHHQLTIDIDNLLADLRQQNEVNGKIIQNNRITVKMLKDVILDSKKDQSTMTYNQKGMKSGSSMYKPVKA